MAEIATIARPYAEAVFALADKAGTLPRWSESLARLAAVAADPQLAQLVGDPRLTAGALTELLLGTAGETSPEARNLVQAMVDNKRVEALPSVREQFELLKAERESTVDAVLESAFEIDASQQASLVADLEKKLGRKVRARVVVDPALIGGVRVTAGDQVIDGSVRGRLASLAVELVKS